MKKNEKIEVRIIRTFVFIFATNKFQMKILILLSRVPFPLEKGDKLRAYHQIKMLHKKHEIVLVALNHDKLHPNAIAELTKVCSQIHILPISKWSVILNLIIAFFKGIPLQCGYFYSQRNYRKIQEIIHKNKPEHIYAQLIRTSEYVKNVPIQKTIDFQDAFSAGMKRRSENSKGFFRWFFRMEYNRLKRYEEYIYSKFDKHSIISEADRDLLSFAESKNICIIPNGIDFGFFTSKESDKQFDLVFTGNMSYAPNILAAKFLVQDIMPQVWNKFPNCKLLISGANPGKSVKKLSSKNVKIGGWVEDIRDSYSSSKIFIAPMQIGTGLQNKLIEAMSMGLPCITSTLANRALKATEMDEILIGKTAKEYAELVIELLTKEEMAWKIGQNGKEYVHANFSWEKSTQKLSDLIER